jgi:hypothetical protein
MKTALAQKPKHKHHRDRAFLVMRGGGVYPGIYFLILLMRYIALYPKM